ncbi:hepatic lectin [Austrofundulus limnaeus]|uniref:Hepatic lectin-like n=1 Tax=Austrofundulus limnaeus TaxID=52670 RepID=A0A2I4CLY4_AUSLI|nr:PREDICTED: hepatic lectin-like [Austrofundulus limnaeus]XP_013881016.1 PREDICTED: hepatic lectin-like [Austrofundulus limnaeus]
MMSRPQEEDEKIHVMENQQEGEAAEKPKRKSKLPPQTVVLLVLCALLAAALFVIYRLSVKTNQSVLILTKENEALKEELLERKCFPPTDTKSWEEHEGKCYHFSTYGSTWQDSRRCCRVVGGDLLKIHSREKQEFVMRKLREKTSGLETFWIGLTDSLTEGRWLWVDGSPLNESLSFWINKEPNDDKYWHPDGEDCGQLIVGEKGQSRKTWNDDYCNFLRKYVCEKSPGFNQSSCV